MQMKISSHKINFSKKIIWMLIFASNFIRLIPISQPRRRPTALYQRLACFYKWPLPDFPRKIFFQIKIRNLSHCFAYKKKQRHYSIIWVNLYKTLRLALEAKRRHRTYLGVRRNCGGGGLKGYMETFRKCFIFYFLTLAD